MTRKDEAALEEREQYVQDLFRRVAPRYDFLNRLLSFRRDVAWRRFTARQAGLVPGGRVLDVATGTGDLAFDLAAVVGREGRVVGLDFTEEMLVRARRKADKLGLGDVCTFVQGNALDLPFGENEFDAATIAFGLRNVVDRERCLLEMKRVVRPGGRVLVLEFSRPVWPVFRQVYLLYFRYVLPWIGRLIQGDPDTYRYLPETVLAFPDQEALAAMMRELGFRNVRYHNLTGGICALHIGEV
ncbi:MAG: bifunctional demethylmenaquinone methyltransferase/2-methoxy-6-polyprenyl-1,4-benzoquinol methylase UbiE [Bacillota bacterium]|nr:MAG: bifunctional demethylmenaquinone methyltransferase/2-methoxy-6-polyprenyl-1,4-benzoquinol methylase UbiE [Bacillota bacterium]